MVLSNKKLKQQIRAKFAEIAVSKNPDSETIQTNPETPKSLKQLLDSTTPKPRLSKREKRRENPSIVEKNDTHVVESSKGKKRRREKVDGGAGAGAGGGGGDGAGGAGGGVVVVDEEVVKRKLMKRQKREERSERRRKEREMKESGELGEKGVEAGDLGVKEGGDLGEKSGGGVELGVKEGGGVKKEKRVTLKKNKKKHKKKKDKAKVKAKVENEGEEKQVEDESGVSGEQIVVETSEGNEDDCKKVYVGGMPYSSTEDDMWSFFDHCGAITDIDCLKFPDTGKFRGIAIISFKTEEAAKKALALDGSDMDGLFLKIQPYKATRPTKSSNFTIPVIEGYNRIYAGNLSWEITEDNLRKLFSDCNIAAIRFGEDKETGEFKGYAHVDFSDSESLTKALTLDQKLVCGRPVKISRAVPGKGAIKNPGYIPALPSVKPRENNSEVTPSAVKPEEIYTEVMPPAAKPEENYSEVMPPAVNPPENSSGVSAGKLKRRTCYECGERGHISSACPKKQATDQIVSNAS